MWITSCRNLKDYQKSNEGFNQSLSTLVTNIFQTERTGAINYVQSTRPHAHAESSLYDATAGPTPARAPTHLQPIPAGNLGPLEHSLLTRIAYGQYTNILLVGEIGSGKTASVRFVLDEFRRLRLHTNCEACPLHSMDPIEINFNEAFDQQDEDELVSAFRQQFYEQFKSAISDIFTTKNVLSAFVKYLRQEARRPAYATFHTFVKDVMGAEDWAAAHPSQIDQNRALFAWIESQPGGHYARLVLLARVAAYLKQVCPCEMSCLVSCFDNLDRLPINVQHRIVRKLFTIHEISRLRAITVVRPPLGRRMSDAEEYVFDVVPHKGPDPYCISTMWMRHFVENRATDFYSRYIPDGAASHVDLLVKRMEAVLRRDAEGRFVRTLKHLACKSVRRALRLMERVFINEAIPYNETDTHEDNLILSVLALGKAAGRIDPEDKLVANIVMAPGTEAFSLICTRLLMLVYDRQSRGQPCRLSLIVNDLKNATWWSEDEIMAAVNYLMLPLRQLLFSTGQTDYKSAAELSRAMYDVLVITPLGEGYLRQLLADLRYVQQALLSVGWDAGHSIPASVDYSDRINRFSLLRQQLGALLAVDVMESERFRDNLIAQGRGREYRIRVIAGLIIGKVGRSVLEIFRDAAGDARARGLLRRLSAAHRQNVVDPVAAGKLPQSGHFFGAKSPKKRSLL